MPRVHYSLRLVLSGTVLARSGAFWFGFASNADDSMASKMQQMISWHCMLVMKVGEIWHMHTVNWWSREWGKISAERVREHAWNGNSWSRRASHMAPKIPCRLKCMWHVEEEQNADRSCGLFSASDGMSFSFRYL